MSHRQRTFIYSPFPRNSPSQVFLAPSFRVTGPGGRIGRVQAFHTQGRKFESWSSETNDLQMDSSRNLA